MWPGTGADPARGERALWEAQDGLKYLNPHLLRLQPLITTERASEREPHKGGQIIKPSRIRNHTRDSPMAVALQRARICTRMESTHSHTHTPHHLACTFSRLPIPSRCVSVCVRARRTFNDVNKCDGKDCRMHVSRVSKGETKKCHISNCLPSLSSVISIHVKAE